MKKTLMTIYVGLAMALFANGSIAAENVGVDIHGFISQGYLYSDETDFSGNAGEDDFAYNEMGINFSKELNENLRFGIQLFSRDFVDMSENEIKIDWAFADYRFSELLGLRFGQIKFPHGLYNEARDIDMLRNPVFLPESVYQELSHDLYANDVHLSLQGISSRDLFLSLQGIGLYGYIDLDVGGGLTYQATYGTQSIEPNTKVSNRQLEYYKNMVPDISEELTDSTLENDSIDVDYKYAGNLIWDTPIEGLRFGTSINNIKMAVTTNVNEIIATEVELDGMPPLQIPVAREGETSKMEYNRMLNAVFSLEYTWENLILMAEYIIMDKEYTLNSFKALNEIPDLLESLPQEQLEEIAEQLHLTPEELMSVQGFNNAKASNTSTGWYVGLAYRILDWLEVGGYYSKSEFEMIDSIEDFPVYFFKELDEICATLRFDINEYWAIKLEAHRFKGVYPKWKSLVGVEYDEMEENWNLYTAKMTVAF